jgi:hypothetical protein
MTPKVIHVFLRIGENTLLKLLTLIMMARTISTKFISRKRGDMAWSCILSVHTLYEAPHQNKVIIPAKNSNPPVTKGRKYLNLIIPTSLRE